MEFVKRTWAQIWQQVNGMSASQKWLVGAMVIIMVLALGWVLFFTSAPSLQPISGFASGDQMEVVNKLQGAGIRVHTGTGQLLVARQDYQHALSVLTENNMLSDDFSAVFDELIANDSIFKTERTKDRDFLLAKWKMLSQVISGMPGIDSAKVIIDLPQNKGFGHYFEEPSGSVLVTMKGRRRVTKELVEAIAAFVSGGVAELDFEDIEVVDANYGKRFKPGDPTEVSAGDALETQLANEKQYREKIENMLGYIPGVIVGVSVRVDTTAKKQGERWEYTKDQPLRREHTIETERSETANAGEPGVRPNTGLNIDGGGFEGTKERSEEKETEFLDMPLAGHTMEVQTPYAVKSVGASINVPRSYFMAAYQMLYPSKPAADGTPAAPPDDAVLQPFINQQLADIEEVVKPLLTTAEGIQGEVSVKMIPDLGVVAHYGLAGRGSEATATGVMGVLDSEWAQPAVLATLGLISMAMMFHMVRKATRQPELPSVEELAGVPPTLPTEEDLIGEAEEHEAALDGVELNEEEIRHRKMAEQIGEMINANPEEAGIIFKKWVTSVD